MAYLSDISAESFFVKNRSHILSLLTETNNDLWMNIGVVQGIDSFNTPILPKELANRYNPNYTLQLKYSGVYNYFGLCVCSGLTGPDLLLSAYKQEASGIIKDGYILEKVCHLEDLDEGLRYMSTWLLAVGLRDSLKAKKGHTYIERIVEDTFFKKIKGNSSVYRSEDEEIEKMLEDNMREAEEDGLNTYFSDIAPYLDNDF